MKHDMIVKNCNPIARINLKLNKIVFQRF